MSESTTEYGIVTPAGDRHWGTFISRPMATEQDRQLLVLNLKALAKELGQDEKAFLASYRWISRIITETDGSYEIESHNIVPPLQQQTEPVPAEIKPQPIEFNS